MATELERDYLSILLSRSGWTRWGETTPPELFTSPEGVDAYGVIAAAWGAADGRTKALGLEDLDAWCRAHRVKQPVRLLLSSLEPHKTTQSQEKGIREALRYWSVREVLLDAAASFETGGAFDPVEVGLKLCALAEQSQDDARPLTWAELTKMLKAEKAQRVYPTGIEQLDKLLEGGIWVGEIAIAIAPPGGGKTWWLCHQAAEALRQGETVVYVTGEIRQRRTVIRMIQNHLRQRRPEIMASPVKAVNALKAAQFPIDKLYLRDYARRAASTTDIYSDVLQIAGRLDTPPVVIIDYLDLFGPPGKSPDTVEGRFALAKIAKVLRRLAVTLDTVVWTATQTNRATLEAVEFGMASIAESIGKAWEADVIIALQQIKGERELGEMRLGICKAREREMKQREVTVQAKTEWQRFEG